MRTRFQQGLNELKDKLLTMGGMAENALGEAIRAYAQAVRDGTFPTAEHAF